MTKIFTLFSSIALCYGLSARYSLAETDVSPAIEKTEVVIIGTIHSAHHRNPDYGADILKGIIVSLKPDAILNELPLSLVDPNGRPIERIRSKDSPCPEVWAADQATTELRIKQIPFDRPDRREYYKETKHFEKRDRAEKFLSKWSKELKTNKPESTDLKTVELGSYGDKAELNLAERAGAEIINSEGFDSIIRIRHSVKKDILPAIVGKYPQYGALEKDLLYWGQYWQERNGIMADNIIKAAKEYPGKRLVVITGCEHRYILRDLLKDEPTIELKEYWEIVTPGSEKGQEPEATQPEHSSQAAGPSLTREQRVFGLVAIYGAAKQHFAYFEQVPQLDWDQAFKEYLPWVEKEQSLLEYYRTLQRFAALLEDGHTQVYLPKELKRQTDNLPIILGYIEAQWVVTERWPSQEILEEDIPPGTVLLEIDGVDTNEYIENDIFPYVAHGTIQGKRDRVNWANFFARDAEVKINLRYPNGNAKTRIIKANRKSANWTPENREKYFAELRKGPDFLTNTLDSNSSYIRFRKCNSTCEDRFVSLVQGFDTSAPSAIVLDLRDNGGGNTPHKTITHLISRRVPDRYSKTRCSISSIDASIKMASRMGITEEQFLERLNEAKEKGELPKGYIPGWLVSEQGHIEPADKHYKGQIIILIDVTTGSAAEDMAAKLKAADNVNIIGEPTNGSTGTPMFYDLPGGGRLRVCTINTPLSGVGVQPDIRVERTINGIAEGRDEVLQAALDHIRSDDKKDTVQQSQDSEGPQTAEVAAISSLTKEQRTCGVAKLWAAIKYKCAVLEYAEVDWDQVLSEYLAKVDEAQSNEQYYLTLEEMVALLKDNHTYLTNIPGRDKLYKPNLYIEPIEGQYVVTDFYREDNSHPGIKVGDIILAVDGKDVKRIAEKVKPYICGSETEAVHRALDRMLWRTENKEVALRVKRSQETFDLALPAVIPYRKSFSWVGYDFSHRLLEGDYGYIRIPNLRKNEIVEEFTEALEEFNKCKGLILDLRDNTGGSDNRGSQIAGRILKEGIHFYSPLGKSLPLSVVQKKVIDAKIQNVNELKRGMSAGPSGPWQYEGSVAILVNWRTGSAAEDFTMGLQDCNRAVIVGHQTAGGTGMPYYVDLPGGAKGRICRNAIERLDGSRFHGVGIQPDIPVQRTIKGIIEDRDEVLEAALDFIKSSSEKAVIEKSLPNVSALEFDEKPTTHTHNFIWSNPDESYLVRLRSEYELDKIVADCDNDYEKVQAICGWVHSLWAHHGENKPKKHDPISILQEVEKGKRFRCVEYSKVIAGCLNALGIPARALGLRTEDVETRKSSAGHVVTEAYIHHLDKWIMVDGQWDAIPVLKNVPLSAVEFQRALAQKHAELRISTRSETEPPEYFKWIAKYLFYFRVMLDNRVAPEDHLPDKLMLVPIGAKEPKVFQRKWPIKDVAYTHSVRAFYPKPS